MGSALLWLLVALCSGCADRPADNDEARLTAAFEWPRGPNPRVVLEIEDRGQIVLELYPELAPRSVARFLEWAADDRYAGTVFHRVIPEFMIQGGGSRHRSPHTPGHDPKQPAFDVADEFDRAPHVRGTLSLANRGIPNSANGQFFILEADAPHLDGRHTSLGRVVEGMSQVDAIATVETDVFGRWGDPNRPLEDVVIQRTYVLDKDETAALAAPQSSGAGEAPTDDPRIASGF